MKIGIIGYGELGSRLAKRLLQHGYEVFGFDICKSAMKRIRLDGATSLSSSAEIAKECPIIITCVVDDSSVEAAILGVEGVINGIQKGAIVIETTTSTPSMTKKVAEELNKLGADIIDAPVSRGIPAAEAGTLSILVGGKAETIDKCREILKILGTDIIHCGDLGTGHAVKAINMMMMACNLMATTEVVTLGLKEGLDLEKVLDVINVSSGENYMTSHHFPKYVLSKSFNSKFSLGLMNKDLNIALKMAEELELVPLMGQRAGEVYKILTDRIPLEEDNMQTVKEIQAWMGGVK